MKKTLKSISTMALALVMLLTLAVPALAAGETYTVTITNSASGHTYEAYQVFAGDLAGNVLSNVTWGAGVNGANLLAALKADSTLGTKFAAANTAADVAKAMDGIVNDSSEAQAFAAVVGNNLGTVAGTSDAGSGEYTISGLAAGYYLVKDADGSVSGNDAYTRFMMEVVADVTAAPKSGIPTLEKKVLENVKYPTDGGYGMGYNDVADYNIGDAVPFKLIGTLPTNYADYDTYNYVFHDTLSTGLTLNEGSVKVFADGTDETSSFAVAQNGQSFTVSIADLKTITAVTAASKITVEYTATLNSGAVIGLPGNPNEAYLEYSNNPNQDGDGDHGETPTDKVIVFTYELDTSKVDGTDDSKLAGAEFQLYKEVGAAKDKNYAVVTDGKLTGWTATAANATTLISDGNGLFKVAGLDDGTYFLVETKAPTGYNLLEKPVELTIVATTANNQSWAGAAGDALTALTIAVDGGGVTRGDMGTGIVTTTIENNKGSTLPSTGGVGTTIFYIVGGVLMAGAALLLITKKRISNKG